MTICSSAASLNDTALSRAKFPVGRRNVPPAGDDNEGQRPYHAIRPAVIRAPEFNGAACGESPEDFCVFL